MRWEEEETCECVEIEIVSSQMKTEETKLRGLQSHNHDIQMYIPHKSSIFNLIFVIFAQSRLFSYDPCFRSLI